jgi:site-specific DNA-methyltransferase (cytosine-N4-specific)
MPKQELLCKMKSYIQPFERQLALRELKSVAKAEPVPEASLLVEPLLYRVFTSRSLDDLADTLTYWETISPRTASGGRYTHQLRREATTSIVRNGISPAQLRDLLPFKSGAIPAPNRRVLRYGPHGAHEYRGKFFPQLVRSLLNIAGVRPGDLVLDPMCGSGTTLVEASLLGCQALGVDMNPLSVLMSRAKCNILKTSPDILAAEYEALKIDILKPRTTTDNVPWLEQLSGKDREYLTSWFSPQVLVDLDWIAVCVHATTNPACRDLFRLCLSNILRNVSWQKNADLRVRKEIRPDNDIDAIAEFVTELSRTVRTALAFLYEDQAFEPGAVQVIESDARLPVLKDSPLLPVKGKVQAIVTSPPYATALPYLDTDRLSLYYLGLLSRTDHRVRDYEMIGNREVTERRRQSYWEEYQRQRADLPKEVVTIINRIHRLNESSEVGFRRRNLSALLAHYFLDMRQVFQNMMVLLRPGSPAYVVIGNNHTLAGNQHIAIETDQMLGLVGQSIGLTLDQTIPMEMLVSRDIFKKNTGTAETILCFRK